MKEEKIYESKVLQELKEEVLAADELSDHASIC